MTLTLDRLKELRKMAEPYPHIKNRQPSATETDINALLDWTITIREAASRAPETPEAVALRLGEEWTLGTDARDDIAAALQREREIAEVRLREERVEHAKDLEERGRRSDENYKLYIATQAERDRLTAELAEARRERDDVGVFARATDELWARVVAACSRALAGDGDKRSLQQTLRLVIEWAQARQPTAKQSEAARDGLNAPPRERLALVESELAEMVRSFEAEHLCMTAPQSGCCSLLQRQKVEPCSRVRWIRDRAETARVALGFASDNSAFRHPAPAKPERAK